MGKNQKSLTVTALSKKMSSHEDDGDVPVGELLVICGQVCGVTSCLFTNCLGCTSEGMCLFLRWETKGCRPVYGKFEDGENEHKTCCILCSGTSECVQPQTCCLFQQQCFCLDSRCAFPCTKEMPCIFSLLPFCVCGADWKMQPGCCKKIKDIIPEEKLISHHGKERAPAIVNVTTNNAPVQQQMVRGSVGSVQQQPVINQYVVQQQPPVMMMQQPPVMMMQQQQQPRMLMVTVPQGVMAGQQMQVMAPNGQALSVTVPAGVMFGGQFQVAY